MEELKQQHAEEVERLQEQVESFEIKINKMLITIE
jgi:hypothetical protein